MKENKSNTIKNVSNKNSIERDIHLLESYAGMTHKMTDNQGRPKLDQAIERVLLDYKRVLKENEGLRKELNEENKRCMMLAIEKQDYFEKYRYHLQQNERLTKEFSNVILVQKVKDKIEELNKLLADIDYKDVEDKQEREFYKKEYYQVVAQIIVLKGLLEGRE